MIVRVETGRREPQNQVLDGIEKQGNGSDGWGQRWWRMRGAGTRTSQALKGAALLSPQKRESSISLALVARLPRRRQKGGAGPVSTPGQRRQGCNVGVFAFAAAYHEPVTAIGRSGGMEPGRAICVDAEQRA